MIYQNLNKSILLYLIKVVKSIYALVAQWIEQARPKGEVSRSSRLEGTFQLTDIVI